MNADSQLSPEAGAREACRALFADIADELWCAHAAISAEMDAGHPTAHEIVSRVGRAGLLADRAAQSFGANGVMDEMQWLRLEAELSRLNALTGREATM